MGRAKAYDRGPSKFSNSFSLNGSTGSRNESTCRQVGEISIFSCCTFLILGQCYHSNFYNLSNVYILSIAIDNKIMTGAAKRAKLEK